jgi:hypothetical protein
MSPLSSDGCIHWGQIKVMGEFFPFYDRRTDQKVLLISIGHTCSCNHCGNLESPYLSRFCLKFYRILSVAHSVRTNCVSVLSFKCSFRAGLMNLNSLSGPSIAHTKSNIGSLQLERELERGEAGSRSTISVKILWKCSYKHSFHVT